MMIAMSVLAAVALLAVLWAVSVYNRLVGFKNGFANAFAQIDVQLKRRHDLIPNLVETAKAYLKHERDTLEAVIAARGQAVKTNALAAANPSDAGAVRQMAAAEGLLGASLSRLIAVCEAYPELKADRTMMQLGEELGSTENRIAFARQAYNDAVMDYNIAVQHFPASVVAAVTGFRPAEPLQATSSELERRAPKVAF